MKQNYAVKSLARLNSIKYNELILLAHAAPSNLSLYVTHHNFIVPW